MGQGGEESLASVQGEQTAGSPLTESELGVAGEWGLERVNALTVGRDGKEDLAVGLK